MAGAEKCPVFKKNVDRTGQKRRAKPAVSLSKTCRFAVPNVPFQDVERHVLETGVAKSAFPNAPERLFASFPTKVQTLNFRPFAGSAAILAQVLQILESI